MDGYGSGYARKVMGSDRHNGLSPRQRGCLMMLVLSGHSATPLSTLAAQVSRRSSTSPSNLAASCRKRNEI
jgi:hypothetical protein